MCNDASGVGKCGQREIGSTWNVELEGLRCKYLSDRAEGKHSNNGVCNRREGRGSDQRGSQDEGMMDTLLEYVDYQGFCPPIPFLLLQHNDTDTTHLVGGDLVVVIHTSWQQSCPPVEEVVVQLAVTWLELLFLQEQWVVEECQRVEDVEIVFLGQDQRIVDKQLEACLKSALGVFAFQLLAGEGSLCGVVVQIRSSDSFLLG